MKKLRDHLTVDTFAFIGFVAWSFLTIWVVFHYA